MTFPESATSYLLFFAVSFVAAAINSVAGGGTFLTFPIFMMSGLTALQANIMSTIALWPGTISSAIGYRSELEADKKRIAPFLVIGLTGGAAGSLLLLYTPEHVFKSLVPWLLLVATLIFTFGKQCIAWFRVYYPQTEGHYIGALCFQIIIALYGGYFGAGIGILTLAMLQIMGMTHIHRMNALKTVLACAVNAVTAIIFAFSGKVIWPLACVMISGALLGGYFGARFALRVSPEKIRILVSIIGFSMTVYFFLHKQ